MAFTVSVDLAACQGYANCLIEAPALFDIDEDSNKAIVLGDVHDEALRKHAEAAKRGCPAYAITITEH